MHIQSASMTHNLLNWEEFGEIWEIMVTKSEKKKFGSAFHDACKGMNSPTATPILK
jgi:hypothetical protein